MAPLICCYWMPERSFSLGGSGRQIAPVSLTLSNIRAKNPGTGHWSKDQLPTKWPTGQHRPGSAPRDGGGDPREVRPGVWLSSCRGLPLGPPLCHPSSFSSTAVAREDPRATVPVPQGLAWSAPPPDSARVLAQTPPLTGDHSPLWVQPTGCTSDSCTLPPQKGP